MSKVFAYLCFLPLVFLFHAGRLQAQSITPQVINAGGGPSKPGTVSLDYSIGEQASITQYNASTTVKLTAGFLQTFATLVTGLITSPRQDEVALQLFPNPAADYTTVKGAVSKPGYLEFQLIDIQGRVLEYVPPTFFQNRVEKEFSISSLAAGLYFIRLTYTSEGFTQTATLKLIKSYR
jgi:hypothetical protein